MLAAVVLLAALTLFFTAPVWLPGVGYLLVQDEAPRAADALLVLAGDWKGERILKACEVAASGFVPTILVSGPMLLYGQNEADLAIAYAVKGGCNPAILEACRLNASSTEEEARVFQPELRRRKIQRLLVVTSNFHTARAGRIFRKRLGGEVEVHMIAAPDKYFNPTSWWRDRQGQKTAFYEFSKTLSNLIGL
ncbi:MAG: YdcF family protein [Bryobacteraceae bacterium]|nr:YdcF family protein [Bryobacteraceae bacterium]